MARAFIETLDESLLTSSPPVLASSAAHHRAHTPFHAPFQQLFLIVADIQVKSHGASPGKVILHVNACLIEMAKNR